MIAKQCFQLVAYSLSAADDSQGQLQADVDAFGAPLTRLSRTRQGLVIETAGSSVIVGLREWPMPVANGRLHGTRIRMICPSCGALRDALHWVGGEWGCRGKNCLDLGHACRHQQRWCPAIRRRAKLLRKLARVSPRGLKARLLREQIARAFRER